MWDKRVNELHLYVHTYICIEHRENHPKGNVHIYYKGYVCTCKLVQPKQKINKKPVSVNLYARIHATPIRMRRTAPICTNIIYIRTFAPASTQ